VKRLASPVLVCALVSVLLCACKSRDQKKAILPPRRLNVVVVTIDTLRADHLGCYGYSKIATPNLDGFSRKGVLFEHAVCQAPLTAPSHASMFTGLYPPMHKVRNTGGFVLDPSRSTLASVLRQKGWETGAFVGASVLKKRFGLGRGFDVYDDQMPKPDPNRITDYPERRAGEVVDRAIAWLNQRSQKPFFLWVHVFDPHTPYDPPSPFREQYAGRPYDGEIAYVDQQLGRLFEAVEQKSGLRNTVVAVLSDHGESLGDHGEYTHGVFLYESTLHIAFLLAGPGVPAGVRIHQQARTIDLLPTVLDLLGEPPLPEVQGTSLTPLFHGKAPVAPYSYAETLFPKMNMGWAELRAIRTNRWKYIRAPKPELYDLVQDPGETTNVIAGHSKEAETLEATLKTILAGAGAQAAEKVETAMVDHKTMQQLKSLGYLGGNPQKKYELTGEGIDPKDRLEVLRILHLVVTPTPGMAPAKCVGLLEKALVQDPTNPTIYLDLGEQLSKLGRDDKALKLYEEGVRRGIRDGWIYSRLGRLYLEQGNRQAAIAAYEKAAQLNPSDAESLSDLALTYLDSGRVASAERVYKWALATGEEFAPAYNGMGLVYVEKKDFTKARQYFEKAVAIDPDLLEAQLNLGRIYKMMGNTEKARTCFETFLAKASPQEYGQLIPKIRAELEAMR